MKAQVILVLLSAAVQAKSVIPSHIADWDTIYGGAETKIPESNNDLLFETKSQPEDADQVFVEPTDRIISGTAAARGQIPWQALIVTDKNSFSGGSLISTEWVLTAAHCLDGYHSFRVTLGAISRAGTESGAITQNSRQAIMHSNYNANTIANDIALLRLTSAVRLTSYINVVRLPRQSEASTTFAGSPAVVSGFGRINPNTGDVTNVLLFANVQIITNAECARTYSSVIQDTNICSSGTNGRGPCTGDSGGPLVVHESGGSTLVGVVSFGSCNANSPGGYARVSKYLAWISSHTGVSIAA